MNWTESGKAFVIVVVMFGPLLLLLNTKENEGPNQHG